MVGWSVFKARVMTYFSKPLFRDSTINKAIIMWGCMGFSHLVEKEASEYDFPEVSLDGGPQRSGWGLWFGNWSGRESWRPHQPYAYTDGH